MYTAVLDCEYSDFVQQERVAALGVNGTIGDYIDTVDFACTDALQKGQTAERLRLLAALAGKLENRAMVIGDDLMHILQAYWMETDVEDKSIPET